MTWEHSLANAHMSSDYHEVAIAMDSGSPTVTMCADDRGSLFDETDLSTQVGIGSGLDASVPHAGAYETMLASERVLRRDWDDPEEEAAWAYL